MNYGKIIDDYVTGLTKGNIDNKSTKDLQWNNYQNETWMDTFT